MIYDPMNRNLMKQFSQASKLLQITENLWKNSQIANQITSISAIISAQMFKNNPFNHVDQSMVLITIL